MVIIPKMLSALAIVAVYMAGYYGIKARFDVEIHDIEDAEKNGKMAEMFGVLAIVLLFSADIVDLSLAPIA